MSRNSNIIFLCLFLLVSSVAGSPASGEGTSKVTIGGLILFSCVVFISLILILLVCLEGTGCWPWRSFRRDGVAAVGIDNPLTDSGGGMGLSEMDVRTLELDPIVFEPLPTLSDLTPRRDGADHPQQHLNGKHLGAIVPFSSPESHVYAHDWFDEPFRNFPRGNIEYIRELGKGWFGQVIEGEAQNIVPYANKMRVVVKVLRGDASDAEQMRFLDESRLYRDGNHGNILKLLGHSIETNPFLLLLEFCALGDLKSYLISTVTRAEVLNSRGDVLRMALDVAKGLEWMTASDITHGDLAARNCQVGSEGRILIGDYGLSTQNFKDDYYWSSNIAIPLRWAAPETLHCTINTIQTLRVTKESNVWTFGVVLWEIAEFGKLPYFQLSDEQVISRVLCEKNLVLGEPAMPSLLLRDELYSLMKVCWSSDPSKRPPISSVVQRLQLLLHSLETLPSKKNEDEFETKWENALSSQPKRKSVSFSGEPTPLPQPPVNFVFSTPATPTTVTPFGKTQIQFEKRDDPFPSLDLWKPPDPEEEDYKQRIERGEITQKVREKSESVQDLMILTHVEPGDLSDGESLVIVDPTSPMGTLRRASSETAINSPGKGSSHTSKITNSFLLPISGGKDGNGPSPLNKTGINIQLTAPTPSPGIAINIIQPTPIAVKREISSPDREVEDVKGEPPGKGHVKRRFVFRDDEPTGFQSVRHASTPLKPSSPVVMIGSSFNPDTPVFDSPESAVNDGKSCAISPISQGVSDNNSIHSTAAAPNLNSWYTISSFGAEDDLGLNPFQSVTTTVSLPSTQNQNPPRSASPESKRSVIPKKLVFDADATVELDTNPSQSQPDSWLIYTKFEGDSETTFIPKGKNKPAAGTESTTEKTNPPTVSRSDAFHEPAIPSISREENVKIRFQEEIAGANEEVGSLLLHDLDGGGDFQLVKENREEGDEGVVTSRTTRNAFGGEVGEESLSLSSGEDPQEPLPFVPSKWNSALNPAKSAIKSPEMGEEVKEPGSSTGIRKSVSFERKKRQLVYEYPPHPPQLDSDDEEPGHALTISGPLSHFLDWELNADDMEGVVEDDWEVEAAGETKTSPNPIDVYRISAFSAGDGDSGAGSGEAESPGLGRLRHTREKLTLDLGKAASGDTSRLENPPPKLVDSGVGTSANVTPLSHCDNQSTL